METPIRHFAARLCWLMPLICAAACQPAGAETLLIEQHTDEIVIRMLPAAEGDTPEPAKASPAKSRPETPYADLVTQAAQTAAIDPALLHAVMAVESGYNPAAVSPRGARGLMQLMPDTARQFGVTDPHDPAQNILAGSRYLAQLLQMFDQDLSLALAAYNAGPGAVLRHGRKVPPYSETRAYIPRVLARYRHLQSKKI